MKKHLFSKKITFYSLLILILLSPVLTLFYAQLLHLPSTYAQIADGRDAYEYFHLGKNLLTYQLFTFDGVNSTTIRPPGYPFIWYVLFRLSNMHAIQNMLLIQLGIGMLEILCVYVLTVKLTKNTNTGLLASFFVTFYPPLRLQKQMLLADSFYTLLLLVFILMWVYISERTKPSILNLIIAGTLLGVTHFFRPTLIFLPLFLILFQLYKNKTNYTAPLILLATSLLMISPWIVRNYQVAKRPVLMASLSGFNLWQATHYDNIFHNNNSIYKNPQIMKEYKEIRQEAYFIEHTIEPLFIQKAVERIKEKPFHYVYYSFLRSLLNWTAFPGTRDWLINAPIKYFAMSAIQTSCLVLALFGLWKLDSPSGWILSSLLVYTLCLHAGLNMLTRYLIPIYPILFILMASMVSPFIFKQNDPHVNPQ